MKCTAWFVMATVSSIASQALAERPMAVDDAGTLARGGAKLEFGVSRDAAARGFDLAAGFAPLDTLELEVGAERLRDRATNPSTRISGVGFAAKWVPLQSELGLSAGLKLELGRAGIDDRTGATATERGRSLTALGTWAFASGDLVHLNLGRSWTRGEGARASFATWGLGLDHPLRDDLRLTVEVFGTEHARPDKQIGLRWTIAEGVKLGLGVGRGNDRTFASAGVAWEF